MHQAQINHPDLAVLAEQSHVLVGPSLNAFVAANAAHLGPMAAIAGGKFMMGAESDFEDERPVHEATVSAFRMGVNPVTNGEYGRFVASLEDRRFALIGGLPGQERVLALGSDDAMVRSAVDEIPVSELMLPKAGDLSTIGGLMAFAQALKGIEVFKDSLEVVRIGDHIPRKGFDGPRQPVVDVRWFEALAYASLHGGRLPTEWEWEYAARVIPGSKVLREYATPSGRLTKAEAHYDAQTTVDVDDPKYPALENGLRHMTGNVWEWMQNRYGDYPEGPVKDPTGSTEGVYRSLRGGSWYGNDPQFLRAARRYFSRPVYRDSYFGFRVVAAPQDSTKAK